MLSKDSVEPTTSCFLRVSTNRLISSPLVKGIRESVSLLELQSAITAEYQSCDAHCRAPALHLTSEVLGVCSFPGGEDGW